MKLFNEGLLRIAMFIQKIAYLRHRLSLITICLFAGYVSPSLSYSQDGFNDGLDQQEEIIEAEQAFKMSVSRADNAQILFTWQVDPCCYMYKDKFRFRVNGVDLKNVDYPLALKKNDPDFGLSEVYKKQVTIKLDGPLLDSSGPLQVRSQGCNEELAICYPPTTNNIDLISLNPAETPAKMILTSAESQLEAVDNNAETAQRDHGPSVAVAKTSASDKSISTLLGLLFGSFLAGLLLTFTPCVLPMIPILSSIIVGQGQSLSKIKGGLLAFTFVVGTAISYASIGAVAGATGEQLQAYFQHPYAIVTMSALLFAMALSMLGVFTIQMPASIQSQLQQTSSSIQGGKILMVLALGIVSALIVGACVSPVLISFLGVAMTSGSPMMGALIMAAMAFGMGVPLIAFGMGAGALVPKAGKWMDTVKNIFGIVLIAVSIYLLNAIPSAPVLSIWGVFLIILGGYFGAIELVSGEHDPLRRIKKAVSTLAMIWGVMCLVGGMNGERNVLQPLPKMLAPQFLAASSVGAGVQDRLRQATALDQRTPDLAPFISISSLASLAAELEKARIGDRVALIDFYADWCTDCVKMDKTTFSNRQLRASMAKDFTLIKIDLSDPADPDGKAIKKEFNVYGPPAVLFIHPELGILDEHNFYGFKSADELARTISEIRNLYNLASMEG